MNGLLCRSRIGDQCFFRRAANTLPFEAMGTHRLWVVDISTVKDDIPPHTISYRVKIWTSKILPLRDNEQCVRIIQRCVGIISDRTSILFNELLLFLPTKLFSCIEIGVPVLQLGVPVLKYAFRY